MSTDGLNWTLWSNVPKIWPSGQSTSTSFSLKELAYISGKYVVAGNRYGGYAYSSDGTSWTNEFKGSGALSAFSVYNDKLYMVDSSGNGYSSSDGINFTADSSYNNTNGTVKVGTTLYRFGQAGKLDSSADNGVNWTSEPNATNMDIQSAASNGTGMVLVTSASNKLVVTSDKSEWKKIAGNLQSIAYNGTTWVVVGESRGSNAASDSIILSSASGWENLNTTSQLLPKEAFSRVAYGNNTFVAMGNKIGTSPDGEQWTLHALPTDATGKVVALTYGTSGGFVAVTDTGDTLNSVDGFSWTTGTKISLDISNVKYVNGEYIATGYGVIWKSDTNGLNWNQIIDPDSNIYKESYFNDITYVNGKYVIVGADEANLPLVLETTGVLNASSTWTRHDIDNVNSVVLKSIAYGDGMYVAAGLLYGTPDQYMMYSSSDLVNWTPYDENTLGIRGEGLSTVYYDEGKFYIAGNDNAKIVLGEAAPGSNNAGLTNVLGQTDNTPGGGDGTAAGTAITWTVNVAHTNSTVGLADLVLADNQAKMELFSNSDYSTGAVTGNSTISLTAGGATTAYIKVTAADNTTVKYYAVTVKRAATPETEPVATISYMDELLTGFVPNAAYSINNGSAVADASGQITIDSSWIGTTLSIVKTGNGNTTTDSSAQSLVIPSRPATPTGVGKTDETSNGAQDGTITNVTNQMEYKKDISGTWAAIANTTVTGLEPGTYYVRTKATSSAFASLETSVTVGSTSATPELTPNVAISYMDELLTGFVPKAAYSINNGSAVADASGQITIDSGWIGTTLSIVKTGNGNTTTDSSAQSLVIPSRSATPTGVGKTDETSNGAQDGTITNVTDQMEYKKDISGTWAAIANTTVTGLEPGTYYVRTKATSSAFASKQVPVIVGSSTSAPAEPNVTADDHNNTIIGLDITMEYKIDNGAYTRFDGSNTPDLSGEHTVKVRVAANGSVPAGTEKTLHFTANLATDLSVVAVDPDGITNNGKTFITVTPAIQINGHRFVYKNFGTGNINVPAIGDVATGYENWPNNGLINAANGDKIAVAEVDVEGKIVKFGWASSVVKNESAPGTNNPEIPVVSSPSGGNSTTNPNTNNGNNNNASGEDVIIIVNGKTENAGKMKTTTQANGIKMTTLTVDPARLQAKLDAEGSKAIVTIPVKSSSNVIVGELNGQSVKNMERMSATLVLQTDQASYTLPASEINIDSITESLGRDLKLEEIMVRITIAKSSDTMNQVAVNAAGQGDFTLIAPPVDFTVSGEYNGKTTEITKFNAYVERKVALSPEIDPNKITTGIVVEPDGTVRHVPTKVVLEQGTFYAQINSLTNSTYGIVWNPITFADVEKHWAKNAVNDMGSRMIIHGVSDTTFNPDQAITRAEFAAIMVRGLGLKLGEGSQPFRDVATQDWYSSAVQTAASYKLINGFEDGTFRPNDMITREQAMTLISRAMKLTGLADQYANLDANETLSVFKDSANAGTWAKDNIALTAKAGLISGRSDGKLAAKANVTRGEVATLIQRLLRKSDLI
ncbi:S-layer homology domain-containing protein [Paenibacillus amylolyticus]|uniref:S-layer homology domain-containing protein n=1 Tax=Paenibacillus amylolyticus TaxID=1451 RepID=UPI003EB6AF9F